MLSLLVFFPVTAGGALFFVPRRRLQPFALTGGLIYFLLAASLFFLFDRTTADLQLTESFPLIRRLGVRWLLGIDGLSFWYVILSALLLPLAVLSSWKIRSPLYFFLLFALASTVAGAFLSFDGLLFYLFFELSLLPLFFLIYLWGGERKEAAAFKFLIYTFFGSLFLLTAFVALALDHSRLFQEPSFSFLDFYKLNHDFAEGGLFTFSPQSLLFCAMALAFAVKTPLFPFHSWLPLAHVQAPAAASAYLAAMLLKMGTYGWFRLVLPLFPEAAEAYSPVLLFLAVFGLLYTGALACVQKDMKKVIAYSSVGHMSFVLLGLFAFNSHGLTGGFYQTLAHAVSSAGLFFLIGALYERAKKRDIEDFGGLAETMPRLGILFFIFILSGIAFPLTGGFVSEFLALLGSWLSGEPWVYFAVLGLLLSAFYMLRLFQRVFFLEESALSRKQKDLTQKEQAVILPLALLVFVMGIFPNQILKYSKASLDHLQENRGDYRLESAETKGREGRRSNLPDQEESSRGGVLNLEF